MTPFDADLHYEVRQTLLRTRAGRAMPPHHTRTLATRVADACADYNARVARASAEAGRADSARFYAERLLQPLDDLIALIRRRQASVLGPPDATGIRTAGMTPDRVLTFNSGFWLKSLVPWRRAAATESTRRTGDRHRPTDEPRLLLACTVADALASAGVRPTTARTGALARLLGDVVYPRVGLGGRSAAAAARKAIVALPEWRTLPPWMQRLPRKVREVGRAT